MTVSYENATSKNAGAEVTKILRRFGCEEIGFYDFFDTHEVLLQFKHRGRPIQLRMSAKGWAQMYLKENPYSTRRRLSRQEYEQAALRQGQIAANSSLREWIKWQITVIESSFLSFEAVFMPFMLTSDGRPLIERLAETDMLPKPSESKVVALPSTRSA